MVFQQPARHHSNYGARSMYRSFTLVPVGPVMMCPPALWKKRWLSLLAKALVESNPSFSAFWRVSPFTTAPATSVGPSDPSVPIPATQRFGNPAITIAADKANSWARPPLPFPVTVTVGSPPHNDTSRSADRAPILVNLSPDCPEGLGSLLGLPNERTG